MVTIWKLKILNRNIINVSYYEEKTSRGLNYIYHFQMMLYFANGITKFQILNF